MRNPIILAAILLALPSCTKAQQPAPPTFDPFKGENPNAYRFDIDRLFYTAQAAVRERARIDDELTRLIQSARNANTPQALTALLAQQDTVMRAVNKYAAYTSLRSLINTQDNEVLRELGAVQARAADANGEVGNAISGASEATLAQARRSGYAYAIAQMRSNSTRPNVSADAAREAAALMGDATTWGPALFRSTLAGVKYDKVETPEGAMDLRTQGNAIRSHVVRSVRERGYTMNQAAIHQNRESFAGILMRTAGRMNEAARLLGFRDYPEQSYGTRLLTRDDVTRTLNAIADSSKAAKDYEQLRVARIKQRFGYDTVHVWDLSAPEPNAKAPRLTIAEARTAILEATKPLGAAYTNEMAKLLDPANGRLDMLPRANRVDRPGFSTGSVGYPSTFYQGRYEGFSGDVVIFAHEAGHAVQNMLMDEAGVLPRYANGPSYFTESFALFNEMLVLDYLARTSTSKADRAFYRQALLDQMTDLYRNAWESLVEQQVFDTVSAGRTLDAAGMERLTQNTAQRFSSWFGAGSEREYAWVQPLQLYTWPLYRINYVYAKLLAVTYFDLMEHDPQDFMRRYSILLSTGYDAPPEALLQRSLGIKLDADAMVARASAMMRRWTAELRAE